MGEWVFLTIWLASGTGTAASMPKPRTAVAVKANAQTLLTLTATPSTITFQAVDPDSPSDAGNMPGTIKWNSNFTVANQWTFSVQSASSTFQGCPTVPASAVTVTCTQASNSSFFGSGTCSKAVALTTSAQTIASGSEGIGSGAYQINLTFTLTDSWKYIASLSPPCSLTLTYTANLP